MADVFISYASDDRARVEPLAQALEGTGYSVWWDSHIRGGAQFSQEIERETQTAKVVVVVWTEASIKSHWVADEAVYARDADKMIPLSLDGVQPPMGFRQLQTIECTDWAKDVSGPSFELLLDSLSHFVEASERSSHEIVGTSLVLQRMMDQVRAVAVSDATVLIQGETGVGKEAVARRVHDESHRRTGPFVKLDCTAISMETFESELFGKTGRAGHLEAADGGTLLLDNVGEIPAELQAKLLRPFQASTFERVGDGQSYRTDVRFIVTTNRDLAEDVSRGNFRRDLYLRLSVLPIVVPPLRSRPEDIPGLIAHFLARSDHPQPLIPEEQLLHLQKYDWPGNVVELKNVVERTVILSGGGPLRFDEALPKASLSYTARAPLPDDHTPVRGFFTAAEFEHLEHNNLVAAMEIAGWRVAGSNGAADVLGLSVSKLTSRLKALHIERPDPRSLYARFGGSRGVAAFTRELFGRAVSHPQLARFWQGRSTYGVLREERLLADFLSEAFGGPAHYVGQDMEAAHSDLDITTIDWDVFLGLVTETLDALRIGSTERTELMGMLDTLKSEVTR